MVSEKLSYLSEIVIKNIRGNLMMEKRTVGRPLHTAKSVIWGEVNILHRYKDGFLLVESVDENQGGLRKVHQNDLIEQPQ